MALDMSANKGTYFDRATMGSTDVLTEVIVEGRTSHVTVLFETNDGKIAVTGSDGGAIGADFLTVPNDVLFTFPVSKDRFYVASATGSTVVNVGQYNRRP